MSTDLQVTRYNPTHLPGILALWARYFGPWSRDRLIRRWNWQYLSNPVAVNLPVPIHVGLVGDQVVGHIGAVPIPMRLTAATTTTVLAATGLVADEAHRWLGFRLVRALLADGPILATAMSEAARKLLTSTGAAPIPLSRTQHILQRRTAGSLARSIRWRLPAPLCPLITPSLLHPFTFWRKPPNQKLLPRPAPLPASTHIRPIDRFDADADALWHRVSAPLTFTIERTAQYLNWRYTDMPTQRSIRLGLFEHGRLTAVAVGILRAKPDRAMLPCVRVGEITELIADDPPSSAVASLISTLCARLDRHTPDVLTAGPLTPATSAALQRLGFTTRTSDEFEAAVSAPGVSPDTFPTPDTAMLTTADGDSLYAFCL